MTGHHDDDRDEDKVLAEVFSRVGPRLLPPEATRNAVHRAAHAAWLQAVARRRRRRLNFALAAGISFLVFGTAVLLNRQLFTPPVSVSAAAVPPGDATLEEAGDGGRRLVAASGELLRLRPQSQIAMKGGELWLLRGAVYVESADIEGTGALIVHAGPVAVRHIGTRYAVAVAAGDVEVMVREGVVELTRGADRERAAAGTALSASAAGGPVGRRSIETWGKDWGWADALAPPLNIDGRLCSRVLEEIANETGRRLQYENDAVRGTCEKARLNGPILELPPSGRLFAVLVMTGLEAIENGERIVIRRPAQ
jgi:ferric-dicitrate binding protein FerR (iron transport regulator)